MDKEYLNFLKNAYSGGLCDEYKDEIRKCHEDKLSLVRLAMRQQCVPYVATKMHEGIITKEYLQKAFGGFLNGFVLKDCDGVENYTYAWFVDYDYDNDLVVDVDVSHISFTVGASVVVPKCKSPIVYVSNRSNVHIVGEGFNHITIKLFDTSHVTIEDIDEDSEVVVYSYSEKAVVERGKYCLGSLKVFNKELRL